MNATINTAKINTEITAALRSAAAYGVHIDALKRELRGVGRKEAQNIVTPAVGKFYGVPTHMGTKGVTFDDAHPSYEAARKNRQRLLNHIYGKAVRAEKAPVVQRFNKTKVDAIQQAIAGMSKAEARAYFDRALAMAFA